MHVHDQVATFHIELSQFERGAIDAERQVVMFDAGTTSSLVDELLELSIEKILSNAISQDVPSVCYKARQV